MRVLTKVVTVLFFAILVVGCGNRNLIPASNPNQAQLSSPKTELKDVQKPVEYGNGVYYFFSINAAFATDLSDFLKNNNCKVEGIAGDGSGGYGYDMGYFVVCR